MTPVHPPTVASWATDHEHKLPPADSVCNKVRRNKLNMHILKLYRSILKFSQTSPYRSQGYKVELDRYIVTHQINSIHTTL